MRALKLIAIASILGAPVLSTTAHSQLLPSEGPRASSELTSLVDCARPDGAKEAKVVEFDAGKSLAKLAVNLGSGRFKLVRITVLDRSEDARPLVPVLEAARIMQGVVTFYTPVINTDPESAHDSFLLIAEMGATPICWAIPGSLLNESRGLGPPESGKHPGGGEAEPKSNRPATTAAPVVSTDAEAAPDDTPTAAAPARRTRSRTPLRSQRVE